MCAVHRRGASAADKGGNTKENEGRAGSVGERGRAAVSRHLGKKNVRNRSELRGASAGGKGVRGSAGSSVRGEGRGGGVVKMVEEHLETTERKGGGGGEGREEGAKEVIDARAKE